MPLTEAVKYVAAAYGAVLVVLVAYLIVAARRLTRAAARPARPRGRGPAAGA